MDKSPFFRLLALEKVTPDLWGGGRIFNPALTGQTWFGVPQLYFCLGFVQRRVLGGTQKFHLLILSLVFGLIIARLALGELAFLLCASIKLFPLSIRKWCAQKAKVFDVLGGGGTGTRELCPWGGGGELQRKPEPRRKKTQSGGKPTGCLVFGHDNFCCDLYGKKSVAV